MSFLGLEVNTRSYKEESINNLLNSFVNIISLLSVSFYNSLLILPGTYLLHQDLDEEP